MATRTRNLLFIAVVSCLGLLATACGSDENPTATGSPTTAAPASSTTSSSNPPPTVVRAEPIADAPIPTLSGSFADLGFDILRAQPIAENAVLSPTSIGHAVLMARAAADEATGDAIDQAINLPLGLGAHDAWNEVDLMIAAANGTATDVNQQPTPVVTIADRIWPAAGVTPDEEWLDILGKYHGSEVSTIDVTKPEESRTEVNQWVSEATQGLIPELLPEGFITPNTSLVLTDAIYFKAQWQTIFGKYGTVDGEFTTLDGAGQPTMFMRELENRGARGFGDGWSAANLPYAGEDFSMLIIVPDEGRFEEVRNDLDDTFLFEVDSAIEPGPYELLLPKWDDKANIDLLPWLTEIGAAPGRYPGISPASELTGGVHAADIAVDEMGTVAAAATGLGFRESGPPEPEFTIAADKPFFYVIRHDSSGLVLFVGQVTNPA